MQRQLTAEQHRFLDAERAVAMFRENEECAHVPITDEWGEPLYRVTPDGIVYEVAGDRERAARRLAEALR